MVVPNAFRCAVWPMLAYVPACSVLHMNGLRYFSIIFICIYIWFHNTIESSLFHALTHCVNHFAHVRNISET